MATLAVLPNKQFTFTRCAPADAKGSRPEAQFGDHYRYSAPAVDATFRGDGEWSSNGLDYSDYSRMRTRERKIHGERRLATPEWALNNAKLQELLASYYESRAHVYRSPHRSLKARIKHADTVLRSKIPDRLAVMDKLSREYVQLKRTGGDPARCRMLEIQIENLDTQVSLARRGPGFVLAVVHCYYGVGYDSVNTAGELHVKPPLVRALLFRLHRHWEKMHGLQRVQRHRVLAVPKPPKPPRLCFACRAEPPTRHQMWHRK